MGNKTIGQLDAAALPLDGTEKVELEKSGVSKRATVQDIATVAVGQVPPSTAPGVFGVTTAAWAFADFANANWTFFRQNSVSEFSTSGAWEHDPAVSYLSSLQQRRLTSAASANSGVGFFNAQHLQDMYRKISGGVGGGFEVSYAFRFAATAPGNRFFFGVGPYNDNTAILAAAEPSTRTSLIGIAKDSTDTNLQFLTTSAVVAATKVDTGVLPSALAGKSCRFTLTVDRGGATATATIVDMDTGAILLSTDVTFTANVPAPDFDLHALVGMNTGSSSTAVSFALHKMIQASLS